MTGEKEGSRLRLAIPILSEDQYPNYFAALAALGAEGVKTGGRDDPALFDGLLLPGGGDIDPGRYGQENTASVHIDHALDELQFSSLERFLSAGKPVFGICRGHQLLNVYFGGTLHQHLQTSKTHDWQEGQARDKTHETRAEKGSWIEAIYGPAFSVNSAHHQGVMTLGRGLTADQYALDGVIEAMHHQALPVYSVQWHPERMCFAHRREDTVDGSAILRWFLERCR